MSSGDQQQTDPDDFFSETRMSFGDHIEDLRTHLWRAIKGFFVACILGFVIGKQVLVFIAAPVEEQMAAFYDRRVKSVAEDLKAKDPDMVRKNQPRELELLMRRSDFEARFKNAQIDPKYLTTVELEKLAAEKPDTDKTEREKVECVTLPVAFRPLEIEIATSEARTVVGRRPALTTLNVQEAFMVYFKVSIATGFVLASPWVFYQIWSFIAAGLYPHEKRYVNLFLPFSLGLFIVGVLVCEFLVMPRAVEALLWFNEWLGLEPDLRLNEWLGFAIWMPIVFGVSFQTPLVMLFLERMGILTVETYRGKRRIAWFLMAVFAAVITPSTDAFSMLFLWVPMSLLYELGIALCVLSPKRPSLDDEVPEPEEMVEV